MVWWAIMCVCLLAFSASSFLMAVAWAVLIRSAVWLKREASTLEKLEETRRRGALVRKRVEEMKAREAKRHGD